VSVSLAPRRCVSVSLAVFLWLPFPWCFLVAKGGVCLLFLWSRKEVCVCFSWLFLRSRVGRIIQR
jgi:hypothetical protein